MAKKLDAVKDESANADETLVLSGEMKEVKLDEHGKAIVDVSNLKEVKVPTFLERIAAIDEQLAKPDLFDLVKDALQKVKAAEIRKEARSLQAQIRIVRNMMPPRVARVPRKPKAA